MWTLGRLEHSILMVVLAGHQLKVQSVEFEMSIIDGIINEPHCRKVYAQNPLVFPEGSSTTCFGGLPLSVEFGTSHKSGTSFSNKFREKIELYCGSVANAIGEPEQLPQEWACGTSIERFKAQKAVTYGVVFEKCRSYAVQEKCTPMGSSRGRIKIVQFVRDPFDMILSAYNYHLGASEKWEFEPRWNKDTLPDFIKPTHDNMTYSEILNTVDTADGIKLEAIRSGDDIRSMVTAYCQLVGQDEVYFPVRFNDFYEDSGVEKTCELFRFLGMREEHASNLASYLYPRDESGVLRMVFAIDPSKTHKHVTAGSYDKEAQLEILQQAESYHNIMEVRAALDLKFCGSCSWCKWYDIEPSYPVPC